MEASLRAERAGSLPQAGRLGWRGKDFEDDCGSARGQGGERGRAGS